MIGFRGAGRCTDPAFGDCFAMELEAIRKVRGEMAFENVEIMIPFARTHEMAQDVNGTLRKVGLARPGRPEGDDEG